MLRELKQKIAKETELWLQERGANESQVILERAAESQFGEFTTNVAMRYAKVLGRNPLELAGELAAFLEQRQLAGVEKVEAVRPGFINIYLTAALKTQHLTTIRERGTNFGSNTLHQGEKWVIEHTSPNPNKAMHIGHLRNNLTGMSIVGLLEVSGASVVSEALYDDRGIAIAKAMYGFLLYRKKNTAAPTNVSYWVEHPDEWLSPEDLRMKPDVFIDECYVLGEKSTKEDLEHEKAVRQMVVDWEAENDSIWKLWKHVLYFAYEGNEKVLARLGNRWDHVWYEHEHYKQGKEYVRLGLKKGIFKQIDDGAIVTDLENGYHLSDTVLLKNDGTSLYITQDLALTDLKKKKYMADHLIWVIGPEQSLHMKQLFAICEQLGIGMLNEFTHISYGYVGLKNDDGSAKKMSSRAGTVLFLEDVIDMVKATIKERMIGAGKEKVDHIDGVSEKLALAAVKFTFLKADKNQDISFDIEQSVDVQGDSGMYVEYTYVRTRSIQKKAGAEGAGPLAVPAELGSEADLLRVLLYYEDVVAKAVTDLSVHHIAQYLLELCGEFNRWYAKEIILDASERESYKVAITAAVGVVIQNGLNLLGIETVEEI